MFSPLIHQRLIICHIFLFKIKQVKNELTVISGESGELLGVNISLAFGFKFLWI